MSAETLRHAAREMREYGARGVAWEPEWDGDFAADKGWLSPVVALAVADLLEAVAPTWGKPGHREWHGPEGTALSVARAYLGETAP